MKFVLQVVIKLKIIKSNWRQEKDSSRNVASGAVTPRCLGRSYSIVVEQSPEDLEVEGSMPTQLLSSPSSYLYEFSMEKNH